MAKGYPEAHGWKATATMKCLRLGDYEVVVTGSRKLHEQEVLHALISRIREEVDAVEVREIHIKLKEVYRDD
jgi:ribosomal protein L24